MRSKYAPIQLIMVPNASNPNVIARSWLGSGIMFRAIAHRINNCRARTQMGKIEKCVLQRLHQASACSWLGSGIMGRASACASCVSHVREKAIACSWLGSRIMCRAYPISGGSACQSYPVHYPLKSKLDLTVRDTQSPLTVRAISLTLTRQEDEFIECRLAFYVNPELYQRIDYTSSQVGVNL